MSGVPIWVPLSAALIGAMAAGLIQTILQVCRLRHEKRIVLVAITSEVNSLCLAIRELGYQEFVAQALTSTVARDDLFEEVYVHLGSDYFAVFHSLAGKLGTLDEIDARDVVRFYSLCKLAADCADPKGISFDRNQRDLAIANLRVLQSALSNLLLLGDDLVQRAGLK